MTGRIFVDTNILVYALDRSALAKHEIARRLVGQLWVSGAGALSTQVLQEFYVTVTRKIPNPLPPATARAELRAYVQWPVELIRAETVLHASSLAERETLSFWDALLVVCAARSGADVLVTEDLQHGRRIEGVLIKNPFRAGRVSEAVGRPVATRRGPRPALPRGRAK